MTSKFLSGQMNKKEAQPLSSGTSKPLSSGTSKLLSSGTAKPKTKQSIAEYNIKDDEAFFVLLFLLWQDIENSLDVYYHLEHHAVTKDR